MIKLNRVVVTGLGALTPIGNNLSEYWNGLIEGKSGAGKITHFNSEKFKTQFACELKNFDPNIYFDRKELRKYDEYTIYGLVAAQEALKDSNIDLNTFLYLLSLTFIQSSISPPQ